MDKISRIIRSILIVIVTVISTSSSEIFYITQEEASFNQTANLSAMETQILKYEDERLYTPLSTLSGDLTGYVYNCPMCTGRLACMSSLDLSDGTHTYEDEEYGELNIVASSRNLECGTVVTFESSRLGEEPIYAIVLDRGVVGSSLDLLVHSYDYAISSVGRIGITYDVIRNGW